MIKLLQLFIILLISVCSSQAQTVVHGSILSINGDPLPVATIDISAMGSTDAFSLPEKQFAETGGQYRIEFSDPGIYQLTVRGVFHRSVNVPILIYDQNQIHMLIYLVPALYNNGEHFDKQMYLNWIRVFGNFNDYDFFTGEIFRANDDGSISAFIKTGRDTIRYQVRGLSNGSAVLPGADDYAVRGQSFEAVLYNTGQTDSVELRFHPDEDRPFDLDLPDGMLSWHLPLSAFIHFDKSTDKFWTQPLQWMRTSIINIHTLTKADVSKINQILLRESLTESDVWWSTAEITANRDSVAKALQRNDLHPQQRAALLISYIGLIDQQLDHSEYIARIGEESVPLKIDELILKEIIETVDPRNPVWAINSDAPLTLLEQSDYKVEYVKYAEYMIKQHADEMVVRNLVLRLIERFADRYRDIREMPYYSWIVERYGENQLARRAITAFQQVTK